MKIEALFPEVCNLFGDLSNIEYLKKTLPDAELINSPMTDEPAFVTEDIDLIYMGPMTENTQVKVIEKLMPHKKRINRLIQQGTVFLMTGNALEIFGNYIENEDGSKIPCLGIFKIYAKRDMMHRHNSNFLGLYDELFIMGFKTQFTMAYPENGDEDEDDDEGFIRVVDGIGLNKSSIFEGIHRNNFFGTYLTGPLLIMNPSFTKYLLSILGRGDTPLAFESAVCEAYDKRMEDFFR